MKRLPKLLLTLGIVVSFFIFYSGCRKDDMAKIPEGQQRIRIMLSDDPDINFQAVNVDIRLVEVKVVPDSCRGRYGDHDDEDDDDGDGHDDCDDDDDHDNYERCAVWDTLDIRPGVYNLLDLANGNDTLLASGFTIQGKITKLRLTLGDNNSVVIDGVSYPLALWRSNHHIIITIEGDDVWEISPNDLQLWLDFDVGRSIVKVRDNQFVLKPFIRVFVPDKTATIRGVVLPGEAKPVVAAIFNGDTLIAIPEDDDGRFKIRGITSTSADVFINATANGYQDTTITGVQLMIGRETDIGTIRLHR